MVVGRVSPEEEGNLQELAQAVAADLRFIGLKVEEAGDCFTGSVNLIEGFVVYYDPSSQDDEGGVFARWKPSAGLLDTVPKEGEPDTNQLYKSINAMYEALRKILEAAGWQVAEGDYEPAIKISRKPKHI